MLRKNLNIFIGYLKPYKKEVIIAPLFMILEVIMDLLQPKLLSKIVDEGIIKGNSSLIINTGFIMFGIAIIGLTGGIIRKLNATDEEIEKVCKITNAEKFILNLPQKYDTVLYDGGQSLSQGQRQLLAISRAILLNPHILILDEATSNIDTKTEKDIQRSILNLMKGRTSFVIAHRLNTIKNADLILVINNGEIIEKGTHKELMGKKGFYYNLFTTQFPEPDFGDYS